MVNLSQYPIESNRTPLQGHTFSQSNGWWRGVVKSEDAYGNERVRLYLWRDRDGKDWQIVHKWNVQADRWDQEKKIADKYVGAPPTTQTPHFPVQHYNVVGGETISKNDNWWTAVVQYEKDGSSTHDTRLYMWDVQGNSTTGTKFKWNIKRDTWGQEKRVADSFLDD